MLHLTIREHHGLVVLIEGGAAHSAHQSALAAVRGGQRVGQGVQLWITNLIHELNISLKE